MKIKNLLILGLVLMGFTYCSSDEVLDGPATGNEKAENLKMEITIQMPTGATTRSTTGASDETKPGSEVGTVEENQANSVTVVITKPGTSEIVSTYTSLASDGSFAGSSFFTTAEFTVADMKINDTFDVYAFVNPYAELSEALDAKFENTTSLETAIAAITKRSVDEGGTQDNFFMSNASVVTSEPLNASHIKGAALKVAVDVQRAVARMDYVANGGISENTYPVAASDVTVKFTDYKLINTSKSFYNLKRVNEAGDATAGTIGGAETKDNYVVDTDWAEKIKEWPTASPTTNPWAAGFFNYMGSAATLANPYQLLTTKSYVTENTMPANNRSKKGLATAVVFKGQLDVPASYTNPTSGHQYQSSATSPVYVWNNKFYGTFDKLPQSIQNIVTAGTTGKILDTEIAVKNTDLANAGVTGYSQVGGVWPVYYVYYNRHNDNGDASVTGPMEFATVRNNIYKLTINSLSKFGHPNDPEGPVVNPDPTPEDPKDPIESSTLYMQVTATVLDWTVRQNNIEF